MLSYNEHFPPLCLEKNVSTFASYADNGIVVTTVSSFMHNFKTLVGCHNSVTEESLPSPTDYDKQTGNNIV